VDEPIHLRLVSVFITGEKSRTDHDRMMKIAQASASAGHRHKLREEIRLTTVVDMRRVKGYYSLALNKPVFWGEAVKINLSQRHKAQKPSLLRYLATCSGSNKELLASPKAYRNSLHEVVTQEATTLPKWRRKESGHYSKCLCNGPKSKSKLESFPSASCCARCCKICMWCDRAGLAACVKGRCTVFVCSMSSASGCLNTIAT
jgi:hypothetical protein